MVPLPPDRSVRRRAEAVLRELGLGERLGYLPEKLSVGEKQRVAIARALVNHPALVLADETTANLDSKTGHEAVRLLHRIAREQGRSVVIVSHDQRIPDTADRVLRLEGVTLGTAGSRCSSTATALFTPTSHRAPIVLLRDESRSPGQRLGRIHRGGSITMALERPQALESWRLSGIGVLRIVFGIVWGIDAWFKWQPDFVNNFSGYLTSAQDGQPWAVHHWIGFWVNVVHVDPTVFAYLVAAGETAIALALILGVFSNLTYLVGVLLSIVIWSTAEGFGGPYQAGSTDIGAAVIYVLVFAGLFLSAAGLYLGLDRRLTPRLGRWGVLASGWFRGGRTEAPVARPAQLGHA